MTCEMDSLSARVNDVLRPLGITRSMKAHRILCGCVERIAAQEDRLEAVQKELYEPLAEQYDCEWTAIQSMVRRGQDRMDGESATCAAAGGLSAHRLPQCGAVSGNGV